MMKKISFMAFFILIFMSMAMAAQYPYPGYNEYRGNEGVFDQNVNYVSSTASVTLPLDEPLVGDLDGDGTNEMVILDGSTLRLFHAPASQIATVSLGARAPYSNPVINDIDSDGMNEVVVASNFDKQIDVIGWDGVTLSVDQRLNMTHLDALSGNVTDSMIGCKGTGSCMMIYVNETQTISRESGLFAVYFSGSGVDALTTLLDVDDFAPASDDNFCFPNLRGVNIGDVDNDGDVEYVVNVMDTEDTVGYRIKTFILKESAGLISNDHTRIELEVNTFTELSTANKCDSSQNPGRYFSPVTLANVDADSDLEILYAVHNDVDEVYMVAYDYDGTLLDNFPIFAASGNLLSNVVVGEFMPDPSVDFCFLGYDNTNQEVRPICGSVLSTESPDTQSYHFSTNFSGFNVSQTRYRNAHVVVHAANHVKESFDSLDGTLYNTDLDELITPYGVFELKPGGFACDTFGTCDGELIFPTTIGSSAAWNSLDVQGNGQDDLLALSATNFFYYDGASTNLPGIIRQSSVVINPCIDNGPWKLNTSLSVQYAVDDTNEGAKDSVSARACLYYNEANQQCSDMAYSASGTTFIFGNFSVNQTTGASILRLQGNDSVQGSLDTIDITFSVDNAGLSFGNCQTNGITSNTSQQSISDSIASSSSQILTTAGKNSIITSLNLLILVSGIPALILWLALMAISVFMLLQSKTMHGAIAEKHPELVMVTIIVVLILETIIGILIGVIPISLVVVLVVLSMIPVGLWLRNMMQGKAGGA